jgi:G3E family GTPase
VQELAGGCLCCASDAPLQVTLSQALAKLKPDRLLLEPTGLAETGRLIDVLRGPLFRDQIDLKATITLVDPRHFDDPRIYRRSDWRSQIEAADVLIANRCDLADDDTLRSFLAAAAELYPPKDRILTTTEGQIDAALLDLTSHERGHSHGHDHGLHTPDIVEQTGRISPRVLSRLTRRMWSGPDFATCGWLIPPQVVLCAVAVEETIGALRAGGAMRIKGVFRTDRGWQIVQADADGVRWQPTAWRTDSRLEVIVPADAVPEWSEVEAALLA